MTSLFVESCVGSTACRSMFTPDHANCAPTTLARTAVTDGPGDGRKFAKMCAPSLKILKDAAGDPAFVAAFADSMSRLVRKDQRLSRSLDNDFTSVSECIATLSLSHDDLGQWLKYARATAVAADMVAQRLCIALGAALHEAQRTVESSRVFAAASKKAAAEVATKIKEAYDRERDGFEAKVSAKVATQLATLAAKLAKMPPEQAALSALSAENQARVAVAYALETSGFVRKDARESSMSAATLATRKRVRGDCDLDGILDDDDEQSESLQSSAVRCPVSASCTATPVFAKESSAHNNLKNHIARSHSVNGEAARFFGPDSALHSWWEVKRQNCFVMIRCLTDASSRTFYLTLPLMRRPGSRLFSAHPS